MCLYRIGQECLRNIAKHSGAKTASVALAANRGHIILTVADKGVGFDPDLEESRAGLGLVGLRERVRLERGRISVHSQPGKGARIEVRLPLNGVAP